MTILPIFRPSARMRERSPAAVGWASRVSMSVAGALRLLLVLAEGGLGTSSASAAVSSAESEADGAVAEEGGFFVEAAGDGTSVRRSSTRRLATLRFLAGALSSSSASTILLGTLRAEGASATGGGAAEAVFTA